MGIRARIKYGIRYLQSKLSLNKPHSLIFEISALYSFILGIILIAFTGIFYFIIARTLFQELDNELEKKALDIASTIRPYIVIEEKNPESLAFAVEKTIGSEDKTLRRWWYTGFKRQWFQKLDKQDLTDHYIRFLSADGSALSRSQNVDDTLDSTFSANTGLTPDNQKLFWSGTDRGIKLRIINYPFQGNDGQTYILQVGSSPKPVIYLLQDWFGSLFLVIPAVILLTSFMGYLLARRILKPVNDITKTAKEMSYKDLSQRVRPEIFHAEMASLIAAFNDMISRLEKSFHHIEEFGSHVAHELKTPLTIIRGESEVALMENNGTAAFRRALQDNIRESDKMLTIIDDLLFLSRMDYASEHFQFKTINIVDCLQELCSRAKSLAHPKNIRLVIDLPQASALFIRADVLHLNRLFINLISNAVKFTPAGGQISVLAAHQDNTVAVTIQDTGIGIDREHHSKIFSRFYRADPNQSGSGLGLSIVHSIARVHNAEIQFDSQPDKGTRFTLSFPLVKSETLIAA